MPNRINSSRQTIAAGQRTCNFRRDTSICYRVIEETFLEEELNVPVKRCTATEPFVKGKANPLVVRNGEKFWLVRPNNNPYLAHYFYLVIEREGVYQCSSSDERVSRLCIERVKAHRASKEAVPTC